MNILRINIANIFLVVILFIFTGSAVVAEETIIQQEKISFEKCVKVIATSESKLSIAPEIIDETDRTRIAVFTLIDGTLTITCDGEKGLVTVSTQTN